MKINNLKLLFSIFCGLFFFSLLPVKADAAPLPDPDKKGAIIIHKYELESEGDKTLANGSELQEEDLPDDAKPLPGISFRVTQVVNSSTDPRDAEPAPGAEPVTIKTNTSGIAEFDPLEQGIYLVEELENTLVESPVDPFLVRIPMTDPAGEGWLYKIHVYPKNKVSKEDVSIDKFVTRLGDKSESAKIGDLVTWILVPSIPSDIKNSERYIITDTLSSYLNYEPDKTQVTMFDKAGDETVLTNTGDRYYKAETEGQKLTVTFTKEGREYIGTALNASGSNAPKLYISISTTLDKSAAEYLDQPIYNDTEIDYKNSVNAEYKESVPANSRPEVHTGGASVKKIEQGTNAPLEGAEFRIFRTEEDALKNEKPVLNADNNIWTAVSDSSGNAVFNGLAYGDYWIVETKAPLDDDDKPYNLLDKPIPFTVASGSVNAPEAIENTRDGGGFTLPATGGIGTILFLIIGIIFVGGAILLFILSKKKKKDDWYI